MHQHLYYDYDIKRRAQKSLANRPSARAASQRDSNAAPRKTSARRIPRFGSWNLKGLVDHIAHAVS
jgi:hypothetical protein